MRKLLYMLPLCVCQILFNTAKAQWTTTPNPTTNDDVSIGINSTASKLSIENTLQYYSNSGNPYFAGKPALRIQTTKTHNIPWLIPTPNIIEVNLANPAAATNYPAFYLSGDGFVGIGTNTPTHNLHVFGRTEFKHNNTGKSFSFLNIRGDASSATSIMNIQYENSQSQNPYLIKATGKNGTIATDRFVVKNNGEVGINVSNPVYPLCVGGGAIVDYNGENDGNVASTKLLRFGSNASGSAIGCTMVGTGGGPAGLYGLDFYTSYNLRMKIRQDGVLEIGNLAAGGLLAPLVSNYDYRLIVQTGILTEQVKVALKGTNDWSDFVFEPSYKLMPLNKVEKYIAENKHLPDVPSAQEVVSGGLNLGKMDATLLQKIEELTLYTIELNKQVAALQQKISILELKK